MDAIIMSISSLLCYEYVCVYINIYIYICAYINIYNTDVKIYKQI